MSKKPGATIRRAASNTGMSCESTWPILRILPSRTRISVTVSIFRPGSTSRPFLISRSMTPQQQEQDGHSHRNAGRDLIQNHRIGAVSNVGGDFDATVDRTGMHD